MRRSMNVHRQQNEKHERNYACSGWNDLDRLLDDEGFLIVLTRQQFMDICDGMSGNSRCSLPDKIKYLATEDAARDLEEFLARNSKPTHYFPRNND